MRIPRRPTAISHIARICLSTQATAAAVVCALGLAGGGCSLSLPMMGAASLSGVDLEPTGTIAKAPAAASAPASPVSRNLDVEDWRRARAALATALDPQGNGATVAWDNPQTGSKGSFIPVAAPYPVEGQVCRAFIARIDSGESKEVVQGSACRTGGTDDWTVRDIKPFRQS